MLIENQVCENTDDLGCESQYGVEIIEGNRIFCHGCAKLWHKKHDPFRDGELVEIAAYATSQQYGGSEEGGWWYEAASRTEYLRIPYSEKAVEDAKAWLVAQYGPEKPYSTSVLGGDGMTIRVARETVEGWPDRRPRYE